MSVPYRSDAEALQARLTALEKELREIRVHREELKQLAQIEACLNNEIDALRRQIDRKPLEETLLARRKRARRWGALAVGCGLLVSALIAGVALRGDDPLSTLGKLAIEVPEVPEPNESRPATFRFGPVYGGWVDNKPHANGIHTARQRLTLLERVGGPHVVGTVPLGEIVTLGRQDGAWVLVTYVNRRGVKKTGWALKGNVR
jgi:hypothetical protein